MVEYKILTPPPHRHRAALLVAGAGVIVVAAVASFAVVHYTTGGAKDPAGGQSAVTASTVPALTVAGSVPATGATNVPSDQVVRVHFSTALAGTAGMPAFEPAVAGTWTKTAPGTLTFAASAPFVPTIRENLVIPAGTAGPKGRSGSRLAAPVTLSFTVAQASTERLQQGLAELGYLPLSFTPSSAAAAPRQELDAQAGTFTWRWGGLPASLTSLWIEGSENVITKAAVMNFENQNGLSVDGIAGPMVWTSLLADLAAHKTNADPYTYVYVSKVLPENLTLYENGKPVIVGMPVNTGAPGADTADGTFPVFEHVVSSRMQGTNPDGSTYDDPDVPWASYFNGGDALHGFVRASYGSPQSNGCVEMAIANAARVWPLTPIGTLVTVTGPAS